MCLHACDAGWLQSALTAREAELLDCAGKLKDARETSQKRQFVVDRLREAEARLCQHAQALRAEAAAAAQDVDALFSAVDELDRVHSGDLAAMAKVQEAVKVRRALGGAGRGMVLRCLAAHAPARMHAHVAGEPAIEACKRREVHAGLAVQHIYVRMFAVSLSIHGGCPTTTVMPARGAR